jgi:starch synthase
VFRLSPPVAGNDPPLFAVISRLAHQKGVDLILEVLPQLLALGGQLVMVGSGDPGLEDDLRSAAMRHPGQVGVIVGFEPALAHQVEAGADFFLMPSRYEPCGLNQMYSLRYGTVPIVRATGGLEDTVVDLAHPDGNGFKFNDFLPQALMWAVHRAETLYRDPPSLNNARKRGMAREFSWTRAARQYAALYEAEARAVKRKAL